MRRKAVSEIAIDVSKLRGIRYAALETQNKLIAGSAEDAENAEIAENAEGEAEKTGPAERGEGASQTPKTENSEHAGRNAEAGRGDAEGPFGERPEKVPGAVLSDDESLFLACLLYDRPYDDLVRSRGLMPSILVDGINEKLLEAFGDTVVAYDGEKPELIGDYIEDLKGIIAE